MTFHFEYLKNTVELTDENVVVLAIENKKLLRNVICSFEQNNVEEYFVFSKDFTPIEFSKAGIYISDPLNVDLESKKLSGKISSYLETAANEEFPEMLFNLKRNLVEFGDLLRNFCDFDCDFNFDVETSGIIKLLQFKIGSIDNTPEELLIMYIVLVSKYLKTEVFVIPFLHTYFDDEELKKIYETLALNHITLLLLEPVGTNSFLPREKYYIVDKDLCEIDI